MLGPIRDRVLLWQVARHSRDTDYQCTSCVHAEHFSAWDVDHLEYGSSEKHHRFHFSVRVICGIQWLSCACHRKLVGELLDYELLRVLWGTVYEDSPMIGYTTQKLCLTLGFIHSSMIIVKVTVPPRRIGRLGTNFQSLSGATRNVSSLRQLSSSRSAKTRNAQRAGKASFGRSELADRISTRAPVLNRRD